MENAHAKTSSQHRSLKYRNGQNITIPNDALIKNKSLITPCSSVHLLEFALREMILFGHYCDLVSLYFSEGQRAYKTLILAQRPDLTPSAGTIKVSVQRCILLDFL